MATLEVHDSRGRVEFVTIGRDTPALFGADPKCDIVLADPAAQPFHGRIRWSKGRYKVEAFPEAKFLEVSGKKVLSTGFERGDEIRVGSCRIFMISPDDAPVDTEKTRVQPRPSEVPPAPLPRSKAWRSMEVAPPSAEFPPPGPVKGVPLAASPGQPAPPPRAGGLLQKVTSVLKPRGQMPGQERIASSPLVLALVVALGLLILLGFGLWGIIAKSNSDRQYLVAEDSFKDQEYLTAIKLFGVFIDGNPKDARVGKAKVLRALSEVRQYASGAGPIWSNALDASKKMVREVSGEAEYSDYSADLADLVLKTAEGLADRAKDAADPLSLAQAEEAIKLHERILSAKVAEPIRARSRVPAKLADARAAVVKMGIRTKSLAAMDAAIKGQSAAGVFAARDELVAAYADLAADRSVVERLTRANDLIRLAVTFDAKRRPAETSPRPDTLGPPTSLVLRTNPGEQAGKVPQLVYALADGYAYALDGANGAPTWHIPVGLSSPFPPQPITGGTPGVLVFDARFEELVRVDARSGAPIWRQGTGEPITDPPLILGNQVVQATPKGKLLLVDLSTGELRGTLDLKLPLTRSPVADENGQFFFVLGDRDSLFVIRRDPTECVGVEYLGHDTGSIGCPPARLGRYLVVPENHTLNTGRWTVFLLDEEGGKVRKVQTLPITGWTWAPPASQGSVVWSASDRGAVVAFAVGPYESKAPFSIIAQIGAEDRATGPAFARARSDRELWLSSGRTARLDLNVERGALAPAWTLASAGPALGPIQVAGKLAVLTQQVPDGPGVALWGINPADGKVAWRTVLGASWPIEPATATDGDGLTTIANDGKAVGLSRSQLAEGGFVEQPFPRAIKPVLPPTATERLEAGGLTVVIPAADATYLLVREGKDGAFRTVELPAALGAVPLFWGSELFVPGGDGRAYLIDPRTGAAKAEPFVPPYDRARPARWRSPVLVEGDIVALADTSGRVRRLTRQNEPRPRLVAAGEPIDLGIPLATDPASTGEAIVVATEDAKIRVLAGRDLSPSGAITLDSARRFGPLATSGHAFVADASGNVLAFAADGHRLWTVNLRSAPPAGPPVIRDDSAWLLGADGILHRRALADGSSLDKVALGIASSGGLWSVGDDLAVAAGRSTIRLWSAKGNSSAKP